MANPKPNIMLCTLIALAMSVGDCPICTRTMLECDCMSKIEEEEPAPEKEG